MEAYANSIGRTPTYGTETESILISHPSRDVAKRYRDWIPEQYNVQTATSGRETLANHSDATRVAILADNLKDQSTTEVAAEIQHSDIATQVVLLSDERNPILSESDESMFDSYLTKSTTEVDFRTTVNHSHRRASYNRLFERYYALAQERAALETEQLGRESMDRARYVEVDSEMTELETSIDELHPSFDESDYDYLFKGLNR